MKWRLNRPSAIEHDSTTIDPGNNNNDDDHNTQLNKIQKPP